MKTPETEAKKDVCASGLAVAPCSRLPRRRVELKLKIGADTRERMLEELDEIAQQVRAGNLWGDCLMGGHSANYVLDVSEDERITHESYFAALEAMPSANIAHQPTPLSGH